MSLTYTSKEAIEDYVTCLRGTYTTGMSKPYNIDTSIQLMTKPKRIRKIKRCICKKVLP